MIQKLPDNSTWSALAGLRFALALVVVSAHLAYAGAAVPLARFNASAAILGFLFISGYSISASVAREPSGYYKRRMIRILPTYYLCLALALIPYAVWGPQIHLAHNTVFTAPSGWTFAGNLLLLQAFVVGPIMTLGPSWTLSVEEFHYAVAPALRKISIPVLLSVCGISAFGYYHWYLSPRLTLGGLAMNWLWLSWAWVAGMIIHRINRPWISVLVFVPFAAVIHANDPHSGHSGLLGSMTVGVTVAIVCFAHKIRSIWPPLRETLFWLGNISYPLYLAHLVLIAGLFPLLRGTQWNCALVYIIISLSLSAAIYHLIDAPIRLRRKKQKASDATPHVASTA
jgi:peptidoglycan/LPS O-acetylase OafA/YrhL